MRKAMQLHMLNDCRDRPELHHTIWFWQVPAESDHLYEASTLPISHALWKLESHIASTLCGQVAEDCGDISGSVLVSLTQSGKIADIYIWCSKLLRMSKVTASL